MAEEIAGQSNAQSNEQQNGQQQGGQQGEGEQKEPPKERVYSQAEVDRIATKVRRNTARDTEISLRRQLNATDNQQQQRQAEPPKPKVEEPPKQNDGESWEEFVERKAEYAGRKAAREEREAANKEESERKALERRKTNQSEFRKRADALKTEMPDFHEVIESAEDVAISQHMGDLIEESDLGPRILYWLCKNKAESARIAELSPTAAAREIGKIEARLEAAIKKPDAKDEGGDKGNDDEKGDDDKGGEANAGQSQERRGDGTFKPAKKPAPDPIEPGSARSANANAAPSDKDDMATWIKKREAEEAAKRRRR